MAKYLLTIFVLFFTINANAQHAEILGSHISYRAIDTLTYEVKLTVIRDCSGDLTALNDTLELLAGNLSIKQKPTFLSKKDITTEDTNCTQKSICAGGKLPYGFEERVYMDTFRLDSVSACDVYFIWTGNKRYSKITTGAANENHFNFAYLNYCATKFNNSHVYTTKPKIIIYEGQNFQMGVRIVDTLEINDSAHHSLKNSFDSLFKSINYSAPYSNKIFFTPLGGFREQLRLPAGLHFDSISVNFISRPMKSGEITSYCIESNEYRKINGITYIVGTTRWDMTLIIIANPNNKSPEIKQPDNIYRFNLCSDYSTFVELNSQDSDTSDTVRIELDNQGYKNISSTYYNQSKKSSINIEWSAKPNEVRTINSPYLITVKAIDNACDIQGSSSVNIAYFINQKLFKIDKKTESCNEVRWKINRDKNIKAKSFYWYDYEEGKTYQNTDTITLKYKNKGWKKIELNILLKNDCQEIYYDSFYLDSFPKTNPIFQIPDSVCFNGDSVVLKAFPNGGSWNGNDVKDSVFYPSINNKGWQKIQYNYTDSNNCNDIAFHNLFVSFLAAPFISVNPDTGKVPLKVYYNGDSLDTYDSYFWEFISSGNKYSTNDNNNNILITEAGNYDVTLTVTKNVCTNFVLMKNRINAFPKYAANLSKNIAFNDISIYPNPANEDLFIDFLPKYSTVEYQIFDLNGKEILKGFLKDNKNEILLKNLTQGFYLIEIKNENELILRTKFLKN